MSTLSYNSHIPLSVELRISQLESSNSGITPQQSVELNACVAAKHTHNNKSILDLVQQPYSTAEKTKLGNLTDNFKGLFANATARNAAVVAPTAGLYVLQQDTNTVWYYNGSAWVNTGVVSSGDMLKAVYDPTSKQLDAFSMGSMVETADYKVMTSQERYNLSMYRGHVSSGEMGGLVNLVAGNYCTRSDTKSVWIYSGGAWEDAKGASFAYGDTKFSYKTADHDGWVKLDGRSVQVALSSGQKTRAEALGWTVSLPDTRGLIPVAASATLLSGTFAGSATIPRAALPNVTLSGTTAAETGTHTHTTAAYSIAETTGSEFATSATYPNVAAFSDARTLVSDNGAALGGTTDNSYIALAGADRTLSNASTSHAHAITINVPSKVSGTNSATHTHTFATSSLNGSVTQTAYLPPVSAKTEFVYLGL